MSAGTSSCGPVPSGETSTSGTSGAVSGASELTPADGAVSSVSSRAATTGGSPAASTHSGRPSTAVGTSPPRAWASDTGASSGVYARSTSPVSAASGTAASGPGTSGAASAGVVRSGTGKPGAAPPAVGDTGAPAVTPGSAGVVSPTPSDSDADPVTGAFCPISPARSAPTASTTAFSGASQSTPDGGSRNAADAGRPCHTCGSASTAPRFPTPEPP